MAVGIEEMAHRRGECIEIVVLARRDDGEREAFVPADMAAAAGEAGDRADREVAHHAHEAREPIDDDPRVARTERAWHAGSTPLPSG